MTLSERMDNRIVRALKDAISMAESYPLSDVICLNPAKVLKLPELPVDGAPRNRHERRKYAKCGVCES